MRSFPALTVVVILAAAGIAGSAPAQTLDAQMQRLQNRAPDGQPAPRVALPPSEIIDSVGGGAIPALPLEVQSGHGVTYVSGGVGEEELAMLKATEGDYNVRLLLTGKEGDYVSDVALRILDPQGAPLVSVDDAGPYFYARLQPGQYMLEASAGGEKKTLPLTVTGTSIFKKHLAY